MTEREFYCPEGSKDAGFSHGEFGFVVEALDDSTWRRTAIGNILLHLLNVRGGPLLWPRLSEQQKEASEAT
ncbi:MAG TPA: hypothetical protein VNF69_15250 [Burkholderiales bacterium]|nr:hypothetical protein [Burkholderiales bacterium]